ncbi:hypothetical protein MT418_002267 [Batrachochytrium dendrobatidis]
MLKDESTDSLKKMAITTDLCDCEPSLLSSESADTILIPFQSDLLDSTVPVKSTGKPKLHVDVQFQLSRVHTIADRLQKCILYIEQDSSMSGYALDPAWSIALESLEPLVQQLYEEPYQQRQLILKQLSELQAKLDALCGLLGQESPFECLDKSLSPLDQIAVVSKWVDEYKQICSERQSKVQVMKTRYFQICSKLPDWTCAFPEIEMLRNSDLNICAEALSLIVNKAEMRLTAIHNILHTITPIATKIPVLHIPIHIQHQLDELSCIQTSSALENKPNLPILFPELEKNLENALHELLDLKCMLDTKLSILITEIETLWKDLETSDDQRISLENDLHKIDKYEDLCESLRKLWKQKMEKHVDELLVIIKDLWLKCFVSEQHRTTFLNNINQDLYSPSTIEILRAEIAMLNQRYAVYQEIYEKINDRNALINKMKEFETSASDPRRLFRPSFQLVEEERFRKTCYPTLLRIESKLRASIVSAEHDHGEPFILDNSRYLNILEAEIADRFVNENIFVLDRLGHRKTPSASSLLRQDQATYHHYPATLARSGAIQTTLKSNKLDHSQSMTPTPHSTHGQCANSNTVYTTMRHRSGSTTPLRKTQLVRSPSTPSLNAARRASEYRSLGESASPIGNEVVTTSPSARGLSMLPRSRRQSHLMVIDGSDE